MYQGLSTPFRPTFLTPHPPPPTAHPGCGWAAGLSVCSLCCSSAPRWGSCTLGPGMPRTCGYLFRCGRPYRVPPGQSCRTSPLSPAMPTSPSGSRSKWWGECQEWWPQCVTHLGGRGVGVGGGAFVSSTAEPSGLGFPSWLRWEVEGAIESWPGGKSALPEPCHGDGEERVCSQGVAPKLFMMST